MRTCVLCTVTVLLIANSAAAQNRGVYPLGMSATNSGVTPEPGFSYVNQLLFYARNESRGAEGEPLATGNNSVILSMNSFVWVSQREVLGGARFSMSATLPIANNSLSSSAAGAISGGGGFGDSYYQPFILGWNQERVAIRAVYGFLAPTGSFEPGANTNVGSGYWTHVVASGQTWYLTPNRATSISAFQMYEFHMSQAGTNIHPGQNLDLDYSVMQMISVSADARLQVGLVGYGQWQTTEQERAFRDTRRCTDPLLGQRHRFDRKCRVAAARGQSGPQIFQGIRESVDIPGVLHANLRLGWFLVGSRAADRSPLTRRRPSEMPETAASTTADRAAHHLFAFNDLSQESSRSSVAPDVLQACPMTSSLSQEATARESKKPLLTSLVAVLLFGMISAASVAAQDCRSDSILSFPLQAPHSSV